VSTGDSLLPVSLRVEDGATARCVRFTLELLANSLGGDIRGLFINLNSQYRTSLIQQCAGTSTTDAVVTASNFCGSVKSVGSGNNVNGAKNPCGSGGCDWGFALGTPGSGSGKVTLAQFTVCHTSLALGARALYGSSFGVFVQSVGPNSASTKLLGLLPSCGASCTGTGSASEAAPTTAVDASTG
jgi:hypothetical protein